MAKGSLARLFWRALDRLDYLIMQARLWAVDTAYSPFPDGDMPD
jgi:hypothetical protein